jgi:TRAP-type C4-dicarboxylate transport system substrate-binding protein
VKKTAPSASGSLPPRTRARIHFSCRVALAVALAAAAPLASAEPSVTIKLGTLAPSGSTWHNLLKEMAARWAQASGGRVKLRIYAGGTQGSEGDMVRKMGVGQLQAASITSVGLHDIVKEPQALSAPGMIDSEAEFNAVFAKLEPTLDRLLEKKGYVPLHWSQVGFARIFCSKAYRTPAEIGDAKMFAWDGDPASVDAWKATGFRPVVLSSTDVVPALQTGMIDCVANVPLYLLTARLFERANHMIDVPWAYLFGATVVRKSTWDRVPADVRPKLLAIARELGARVDAEVKRLNDDAVVEMKKQGLVVVEVDRRPWFAAAEKSWPVIRGKVVPAAFFDEVLKARNEYRASKRGR